MGIKANFNTKLWSEDNPSNIAKGQFPVARTVHIRDYGRELLISYMGITALPTHQHNVASADFI